MKKLNSDDPLPKKVVRFFGNNEYALETIENSEITFIRTGALNDPFDLWLRFDLDFNGHYPVLAWIRRHRPSKAKLIKSFQIKNYNEAIAKLKELRESWRANAFIFSTCEAVVEDHPRQWLQMWGYYGGGHRGAAIEFDVSKLDNGPNNKSENSMFWKMDYRIDTPVITASDVGKWLLRETGLEKNSRHSFSIKHPCWASEKEWRGAIYQNATQLNFIKREIDPKAITAIFLGCRMPKLDQLRYFRAAAVFQKKSEHYIPIFCGKQVDRKLEIAFEPIDWQSLIPEEFLKD